MPDQYDNDFPRGGPLLSQIAVQGLASDIAESIQQYDGMPRVQAMVIRWHKAWLVRREAQWNFDKRRDEHECKVQDDKRLRDEAAGPPAADWCFEAVVMPMDDSGERPVPHVIMAWVPPDLLREDRRPKHRCRCRYQVVKSRCLRNMRCSRLSMTSAHAALRRSTRGETHRNWKDGLTYGHIKDRVRRGERAAKR